MGAKGPSRTLDTAATLIYVTDCRITEICPLEDIFIRPLEWLTASVFLFKTIISLTANMFCRAVLWCDITDGQVKKLFRPGGKKKMFCQENLWNHVKRFDMCETEWIYFSFPGVFFFFNVWNRICEIVSKEIFAWERLLSYLKPSDWKKKNKEINKQSRRILFSNAFTDGNKIKELKENVLWNVVPPVLNS